MAYVALFRRKQLVVVFMLFMVWGCAYQLGNLDNPGGGFNLIPQGTEIQMGMEASGESRRTTRSRS